MLVFHGSCGGNGFSDMSGYCRDKRRPKACIADLKGISAGLLVLLLSPRLGSNKEQAAASPQCTAGPRGT